METYIWNTIIVLSKITVYVGFACITGYTFFSRIYDQSEFQNKISAAKPEVLNWLKVSVLFALVANVIWFLAKTGVMAEEGVQGAFDPDMLDIMLDSSVGDVALLRAAGLISAILVLILPIDLRSISLYRYTYKGILVVSLLLLTYSYTLLGHVSELDKIEKALLSVHLLVMAWWFGALYPLKQACHIMDNKALYHLMDTFGRQASVMVSLLLFAGLWLAFHLIGSVEGLFTSRYGQILLLKLFLVIGIFYVAAKHKLKLVPLIKYSDCKSALSKSISIEIVLAFSILSITAILSSVVGPIN